MPAAPLASLERLGQTFAALEQPVQKRRMLVIVNPYATTVSDRLRSLVVHALESRYEVTAINTERRGHATELVREAAEEGYEVVVAFGGDGTVNEAANGLVGTDVPLTHLPGGATNVFGRTLGIPGELVDATEHLLRIADDWRPRRVDLGLANGRHFTFAAGYGLDASVVKAVDSNPERKRKYGEWYFSSKAVQTFVTQYVVRPPKLAVEAGGQTLYGITAVAQNGDPFTYFNKTPIHLAENVGPTSGDLGGAVLHRASPAAVPSVAARLLSKRLRAGDSRYISLFEGATEVRMWSVDGRPIPFELDGDWVGDATEVEIRVLPGALSVLA